MELYLQLTSLLLLTSVLKSHSSTTASTANSSPVTAPDSTLTVEEDSTVLEFSTSLPEPESSTDGTDTGTTSVPVSTSTTATITTTTTPAPTCTGMYILPLKNGGCDTTYLYASNGCCVSQDWIIGLSAGLGGFVILCLVIAIIVVCVQLNKSKKFIEHHGIAQAPTNAYEETFDSVQEPTRKLDDDVSCNTIKDAGTSADIGTFAAPVVKSSALSPAMTGNEYTYLSPKPKDDFRQPREDLTKRPLEPVHPEEKYKNPYPDRRHEPYDDPYPARDRREPYFPPAAGRPQQDAPYDQDYYNYPDRNNLPPPERSNKPKRNVSLREETKPFNYLNATSKDHVGKGMNYDDTMDFDGRDEGISNRGYQQPEPKTDYSQWEDLRDFTPTLDNIDTKTEIKINRPQMNSPTSYDYNQSPNYQSGHRY